MPVPAMRHVFSRLHPMTRTVYGPLHNQFIQCCQAIFLNRAVRGPSEGASEGAPGSGFWYPGLEYWKATRAGAPHVVFTCGSYPTTNRAQRPPASSFVILRRTNKPACRRRGSPKEDSSLAGKDLNFNEAKVVRVRVVGSRLLDSKPWLNTNAPPQPDLLCSAQALDSR